MSYANLGQVLRLQAERFGPRIALRFRKNGLYRDLSWERYLAEAQAGAMALVTCLMGFFGGLVMSAIKRDRGVKDWGHMIEGHGGMLDRLDSVIFAAPIFFHVTRFWWTA